MGGKGIIFISGEVTSNVYVNVEEVTKRVLREVGYKDNYTIINNIGKQSHDIAQGVDCGGAGDQGMMFGYACSDTKEYLPTAVVILQRFSRFYDKLQKNDSRFYPDGKAQITGEYDRDGKLLSIKDLTISYQNSEDDRKNTDQILKNYLNGLCKEYGVSIKNFHINPTGKFLIGGFEGDVGLTGRKIVVDNYQSFANVGGGCFSGKCPTKVDRSGAYKARQIAIKTLQEYNLKWCEVQLSYAIGMDTPLAIYINSDKGNILPSKQLYEECKPINIISRLNLLKPHYYETAMFGHFGNKNFSWEI